MSPGPREEALTIGAAPRRLEGRIGLPAGAVRGGAIVCHPHPQYGGDMDHPVVVATAAALAEAGQVVLRFNFGGVGRSEGTAGGGPAEVADAGLALAALRTRLPRDIPVVLAGYSFGAWVVVELAAETGAPVTHVVGVAPPLAFFAWDALDRVLAPVVFVVGDRDEYCPADRLAAAQASHPHLTVQRLPGADHFLAGREGAVAGAVAGVLASS